MQSQDRSDAPGREALAGTLRVFSAEVLVFPTGLVTVAFLTRWLGVEGYGIFSLAAIAVALVEWSLISLFARSTILTVRGAADWRPLAARILQLHFVSGLLAGAALWLAAPLVASGLDVPSLSTHLRLFALDVPLFVLSHAHRNISTARGGFGHRARIIASRWISRMVLIVLLVVMGLSITGAIVASIGASVVELVVALRYDRPSLLARSAAPVRPFLVTTAPLLTAAVAHRVVLDMDLFALKALGASTAEAGYYAAARSLALAGSAFSAAFGPLMLSTLVRLVSEGALDHARDMARDALRLVLLLVPFAALTAGAAGGIVRLAFGEAFAPAGPLLARLVFASMASAVIAMAGVVLVSGGELRRPAWIQGLLVPAALAGHVWAIPRYGAVGAAWISTGAMIAGAVLTLAAVARMWGIAPPAATIVRTAVVALAAGLAARAGTEDGLALVGTLAVLAAAIPVLLLALGEFTRRELDVARRAVFPPPRT